MDIFVGFDIYLVRGNQDGHFLNDKPLNYFETVQEISCNRVIQLRYYNGMMEGKRTADLKEETYKTWDYDWQIRWRD